MASAPIWYKDLTISSPSFSWFVTAKILFNFSDHCKFCQMINSSNYMVLKAITDQLQE